MQMDFFNGLPVRLDHLEPRLAVADLAAFAQFAVMRVDRRNGAREAQEPSLTRCTLLRDISRPPNWSAAHRLL